MILKYERAHVNWSVFEQVGYDLEHHILELKFKDNGHPVRQYLDLPMSVFRAFMRSKSKSNYFMTRIKGKYPEKKITG